MKQCIEDFRDADIGVWMLTGDKGLTAKEIGVSCGLIPAEGAGQNLKVFEDDNTQVTSLLETIRRFNSETENVDQFQVLISGVVIAVAMDNESLHPDLSKLLLKAQSVIVYRSSPY